MKNIKKRKIILSVFMLGIGLGFMVTWAVMSSVQNGQGNQQQVISAAGRDQVTSVKDQKSTMNLAESPIMMDEEKDSANVKNVSVKQSNSTFKWEPWDKEETYLGGDEVTYGKKVYRAKWWTLGETPGKADVWEDTKQASMVTADKKSSAVKNGIKPGAGKGTGSKAKAAGKQDDGGFKVVGYFPSWKPGEAGQIRYDVLTHIIYAFAIPTADGGLRPLENASTAKKIVKDAHANGDKVLLAVGGWSYQDVPLEATFLSATENSKKIKKFGNAIIRMCEKYGFDGIDMDWEHPRMDGNSYKQYEKLMLYLAKELHARGKILTSAVVSGATPDGNIYYDSAAHTDKVLDAVDWINVMAYDGGDGERHSSYAFAKNCATYWHDARGLAAEKVVLGVPFYGRPSWASYRDILKADASAWKSDKAQVNGMTAYYNGISTIKKKSRYAKKNLGGIMIWEITQDTTNKKRSLLTAIGEVAGE